MRSGGELQFLVTRPLSGRSPSESMKFSTRYRCRFAEIPTPASNPFWSYSPHKNMKLTLSCIRVRQAPCRSASCNGFKASEKNREEIWEFSLNRLRKFTQKTKTASSLSQHKSLPADMAKQVKQLCGHAALCSYLNQLIFLMLLLS